MPIPKIAHRIWFGYPFPDQYQDYLKSVVAFNPDYTVKVWVDSRCITSDEYEELRNFCDNNTVQIYDISNHRELLNSNLIDEEVERSKNTPTHRRLCYVRASDIARISILHQEGGKQTALSIYRFLHPNCNSSLNFVQSKKSLQRMAMLAFFLNLKVQI